jgi:cysteine desulfurase
MGVPFAEASGSVRFSLGRYNSGSEIDFVIERLPEIVADLRRIAASGA